MRAPAGSRDARLLLAASAIDAFGTGLTVPFLVVYLHAVRGIALETVGLIVAVPAVVALMLLGPVGGLVDRVGSRRVTLVALAAAATGAFLLSVAETPALAFVARCARARGRRRSGPPTNRSWRASYRPKSANATSACRSR